MKNCIFHSLAACAYFICLFCGGWQESLRWTCGYATQDIIRIVDSCKDQSLSVWRNLCEVYRSQEKAGPAKTNITEWPTPSAMHWSGSLRGAVCTSPNSAFPRTEFQVLTKNCHWTNSVETIVEITTKNHATSSRRHCSLRPNLTSLSHTNSEVSCT